MYDFPKIEIAGVVCYQSAMEIVLQQSHPLVPSTLIQATLLLLILVRSSWWVYNDVN